PGIQLLRVLPHRGFAALLDIGEHFVDDLARRAAFGLRRLAGFLQVLHPRSLAAHLTARKVLACWSSGRASRFAPSCVSLENYSRALRASPARCAASAAP